MRFALTLALGTCLLGCARQPPAGPLLPATAAAPNAAPRLLFFSGRLTAAAQGPSLLQVVQVQAVAGELKQAPADAAGPNLLRLTQLDARGRPLARLLLAHPLLPSVEHVGDDQRTFQRSQVQVPTAEFFARLALQPGATTLRVEEIRGQLLATLTDVSLAAAKP